MSNITRWVSESSYFSSLQKNVDTAIIATIFKSFRSWFQAFIQSSFTRTLQRCSYKMFSTLDFYKHCKKLMVWVMFIGCSERYDCLNFMRYSLTRRLSNENCIFCSFIQFMSSCLLTSMCDRQNPFQKLGFETGSLNTPFVNMMKSANI